MAKPGVKVKIKSLSLGLTGGGLGWDIDATELRAARGLLAFLEDRRILFNPPEIERRREIDISVDEIRSYCTGLIPTVSESAPVASAARGIRQACRRFLNDADLGMTRAGKDESRFFLALGEFRGAVGLHVAAVSKTYDIEIEPDLASLQPAPDDD